MSTIFYIIFLILTAVFITVRHYYISLILPRKKDYLTLLSEANRFTVHHWGNTNDSANTTFLPKAYNDEEMKKAIFFIVEYIEAAGIENIGSRCNIICIDIHNKLKAKYNIQSIVTSGDVYINGKRIYHANKKMLIAQFGKSVLEMKHHVWLTIGEYVIDPTIISTLFLNNYFSSEETCSDTHMILFYKYDDRRTRVEDYIFEYIPQFVGKGFYERTQYTGKQHLILWRS